MALAGIELGRKLVEAGIVPANACRVFIDIDIHRAVKVYYTTHPDDSKLLDVDFSILKRADVEKAEPATV